MPATFWSYHLVTSHYILKWSLVLRLSINKFMNIFYILYAYHKFHSSVCIILFHSFYVFLMTCSFLLRPLWKKSEYLGETSGWDTKIHKRLMKHVRHNYIGKYLLFRVQSVRFLIISHHHALIKNMQKTPNLNINLKLLLNWLRSHDV